MAALRSSLAPRVLVVLLLFAAVGVSTVHRSAAHADTEVDLSGEWGFSLSGSLLSNAPCIGSMVQRGSALTTFMSCDVLGFVELQGTVDPATGTFGVSGTWNGVAIDLTGTAGTNAGTLTITGPDHTYTGFFYAERGLVGRGMVACPEPSPLIPLDPEPRRIPDSSDALRMEQYAAGLVATLPCLYLGDVNLDGAVNAIDAQLVLQYTAGLIAHFPPY
jgi:hypothetical protein